MAGNSKALKYSTITRGAKVSRQTYNYRTGISLAASAIYVMTDFNEITPFAIEPTASIDATNDKMIACGVRLLFVTGSDGSLLGLVTSTDVLGEKPVQYLREHGGARSDIVAQDIMTPHDRLEAVQLTDVVVATVGDIIETLKQFQRQHVLVVEKNQATGEETIRGLFSTTQITRQTGIEIALSQKATSFSDLKQAITSS